MNIKYKFIWGIILAVAMIWGRYSVPQIMAQAPEDAGLKLISSDKQAVILELTVSDFDLETVEHEGQVYHRIIIPDTTQLHIPGAPEVPIKGTMIGVPSLAGVSIEVIEADYETLNGYFQLHPAPSLNIIEDGDTEDWTEVFTLDQTLYATDAFYPDQHTELETGLMRDQAVAQVKFYPVQYNPVKGEVRVYQRILARVSWDEALISSAATETKPASPAYERVLRNSLLNYETLDRPPLAPAPVPSQIGGGIGAAAATPQLKISVTEDGIYKITPADIPTGFTVDIDKVKLSNRGIEHAILVYDNGNSIFDGSDYILFYGTAITNDIYTTENIYWLENGSVSGKRMTVLDGTPGSATLAQHFPVTLHVEQDSSYWKGMPNGTGQDHWFWGDLLTAPEIRAYNVTLNNISTITTTAHITIQLKGRRDWDWSPPYPDKDHQTRFYVNSSSALDDQQWDGYAVFEHAADIPHSTLVNGNNVINIEAVQLGPAYNPEQIYVNWIEIDYWDTYVAENDQLLFGAPAAGTYKFEVTNFSNNQLQVFEITDSANVKAISNIVVDTYAGGYKLQFERNAQTNTRYLGLTSTQYKTPADIVLDQASNWKSNSNGADYIIITHNKFLGAVSPLASHRSSSIGGNYRVATVDVQDIYDEFNDGIFNPQAIQDFLEYTYNEWQSPAPTFVLLVGSASEDYRNLLDDSWKPNYVPTQMVETLWGQAASDNWFVLLSGVDVLPDMFVGRITPRNVSQTQDMVAKIINYDLNPPSDPWNKKALFVADDDDDDVFENTSNQLISQLPYHFTASQVYVGDYPAGANPTPNADIITHINNGAFLVNYSGHGGTTLWGQWQNQTFFNWINVRDDLQNVNKLPVVTVADCLNGNFSNYKSTSIAEEFLFGSNKGAIAIWAESSLGYASEHKRLLGEFYDYIFQEDKYALGEVTTLSKIAAAPYVRDDVVKIFLLFGDPAQQLGLSPNYPYVESVSPANGAMDVPVNQAIQITFSKPMDTSTVNLITPPGTSGFSASWNSVYTQVTYTHNNFPLARTLAFEITGQDNVGNALQSGAASTTWSFTTPTPPGNVTISGSTTPVRDKSQTYIANVTPITTTLPLAFTWQTTDHSPQTHNNVQSLSDTMSFTWVTTGTKTITVRATNSEGSYENTYQVEVTDINGVFLPIIIREN